MRLRSQYRSRIINTHRDLRLRFSLEVVGVTFHLSELSADTTPNLQRLDKEGANMRKTKNACEREGLGRRRRQDGGRGGSPRGGRTRSDACKAYLKIYTLARHWMCWTFKPICLKKNKLPLGSEGARGPWSGPSMFLGAVLSLRCLKADFFTITFSIKAWIAGFQAAPFSEVEVTQFYQSCFSADLLAVKVKKQSKQPGGEGYG